MRPTEIVVYVILILIGCILILVGLLLSEKWGVVLLSIGASVVAASVVSIILRSVIGDPFTSLMESIKRATNTFASQLQESVTVLDRTSKTGLVSVWTQRIDLSIDIWIKKIKIARGRLDFLAYAMAFLPEYPDFVDILHERASAGCKVRILLANPEAGVVAQRSKEEKGEGSIASRIRTSITRLSPLLGVKGIEVRLHQTPLYCSIYRFDSEMFVTPHLYGVRGAAAPLLHFKEIHGGLFSRYEAHFQAIWDIAEELKQWPNEGAHFG
jgi:hypothetical protein